MAHMTIEASDTSYVDMYLLTTTLKITHSDDPSHPRTLTDQTVDYGSSEFATSDCYEKLLKNLADICYTEIIQHATIATSRYETKYLFLNLNVLGPFNWKGPSDRLEHG